MRITITRRIGFATATILLFIVVMVLYAYHEIQNSRDTLHSIAQIEAPISTASYEMEINIVEIGLGVFNYLDEPRPEYSLQIQKDISEFMQFMSQYKAFASSTDAQNMSKQLASSFQQYSSQAALLQQDKDTLVWLQIQTTQTFQEMDSVVDILINHLSKSGFAQRQVLLEMKEQLAELNSWLSHYADHPLPNSMALIAANTRNINATLTLINNLSLSAQGKSLIERLIQLWQLGQSPIQESLLISQRLANDTENFNRLRQQLDDLLDNKIQAVSGSTLAAAQKKLEADLNLATLRFALLIPLFVVLLLVSMFQLWRTIQRPIAQLVLGTQRIGLGDLDHRITHQGDDELAQLAAHFNQMTGELQESRRDTQEMAHRQLLHAEVLQKLIRDIEFHPGSVQEILGYICETIARTLAASRTSIWMFNKEKKWLRRLHTYTAIEDDQTPPDVGLDMQQYPLYNQALGEGNILTIADTRTDPCGAEMLRVANITWADLSAILDVPFYSGDNLLGIFSSTHAGTAHTWYPEEVTFCQGAASLISLVMEQEESRRSRQEAEDANRAKSAFLSRMSHELRTPLNSILGFSQFIQEQRLNLTSEQQDAIMMINSSGKHLLQLINEVLDIAHVESGKLDLHLEPVWMHDVLNDCEQLLASMTKIRKVTLVIKGSIEGAIIADALRFKQVLLNLMSNAIKYNQPGGSVTVECIHVNSYLRINVIDTGIGIPVDKQSVVFVPFNRFAKNVAEGTGIGLTITKQLTEAMGGRIGFSSEPGAGSTFWLEFRRERRARARATEINVPAATQVAPAWAGVTGTVLYVEDTPANVLLLRMIMKRQMPEVTLLEAGTGEQGVELAMAKQPDLILMDVDLPGISGIEALKLLKNDPATRIIPVIALSATAMQQDIDRAMVEGFNAYITKPFNIEKISGDIAQYLKIPSSL